MFRMQQRAKLRNNLTVIAAGLVTLALTITLVAFIGVSVRDVMDADIQLWVKVATPFGIIGACYLAALSLDRR